MKTNTYLALVEDMDGGRVENLFIMKAPSYEDGLDAIKDELKSFGERVVYVISSKKLTRQKKRRMKHELSNKIKKVPRQSSK